MYGWTGKLLEVDLGSQTNRVIEPDLEIYRRFLGGKGLAGYYLRPHFTRAVDDAEMPIVLATVLSTFVVMAVTGWTAAALEKQKPS